MTFVQRSTGASERPRLAECSMVFMLALGTACPGDDVTATPGDGGSTGEASGTTASSAPPAPESSGDGTTDTSGGTDTSGSPVPTCGDGVIDDGEQCDGEQLGGEDCASQGFLGGALACSRDCTLDVSACNDCGDDVVGPGEACDGMDLAGQDCIALGFDDGTLGCAADCTFDTSACIIMTCTGPDPAAVREGMEQCDGIDLAGQDCAALGFDGGALGCFPMGDPAECTFDTSGCHVCGDGIASGPEACDGMDLGGQDCVMQGFDGGTLGCALDCAGFYYMGCVGCGNGIAEGMEACDGADLLGQDCADFDFLGGTLACDGACAIDTAGCNYTLTVCSAPATPISTDVPVFDTISLPPLGYFVGDVDVFLDVEHGWVGDLEVDVTHVESGVSVTLLDNVCGNVDDILATFDMDAAAPPDCVSPIAVEGDVLPDGFGDLRNFEGIPDEASTWELAINDSFIVANIGTLNEWCLTVDAAFVDPTSCGDGFVTFGEECEGANLGGEDCTSLGYLAGGTLACDGACAYDTSLCDASEGLCANSVIESDGVAPDEECDGNELGGQTCAAFGFLGGSLDCEFPGCSYDIGQCSNAVVGGCSTPGAAIGPDVGLTSDIINLVNAGAVGDVDVYVSGTHVSDGDLTMQLVDVDTGTMVDLVTGQCGNAADFHVFFNDEADEPRPDCVTPTAIEGNVRPAGSLASFDNAVIAGDWELRVTDDVNGGGGTLTEWCLWIRPQ